MKEKISLLGCRIVVSPTVKSELIAEPEKYPDAVILEKNVRKGLIQEIPIEIHKMVTPKSIGRGEHETIVICASKGGIPITDDQPAINLAISKGLKPKTSEIILLELLKNKTITPEEFQKSFQSLCEIKALKLDVITLINQKARPYLKNETSGEK